MSDDQELRTIKAIISRMDPQAQARVHMIAGILRDLINAPVGGHEAELAFTLVLAERARS